MQFAAHDKRNAPASSRTGACVAKLQFAISTCTLLRPWSEVSELLALVRCQRKVRAMADRKTTSLPLHGNCANQLLMLVIATLLAITG